MGDFAIRRSREKISAMIADCGDAMRLTEVTKSDRTCSIWTQLALIQNDLEMLLRQMPKNLE
jgi:hypothetical protein